MRGVDIRSGESSAHEHADLKRVVAFLTQAREIRAELDRIGDVALRIHHKRNEVMAFRPVVVALEIDAQFIGDVSRVPLVSDVLGFDNGLDGADRDVDALRGAGALWRPFLAPSVIKHRTDDGKQEVLYVVFVFEQVAGSPSLAIFQNARHEREVVEDLHELCEPVARLAATGKLLVAIAPTAANKVLNLVRVEAGETAEMVDVLVVPHTISHARIGYGADRLVEARAPPVAALKA